MKISEKVRNIVPSGTMAINAKVFDLKAGGVQVINLSVGEPDFDTPQEAKDGAIRAMEENLTRYTKAGGLPELKDEICRKLETENGLHYEPEQIVVSNGAKQGVANACFALIDPGDEVLIPTPYYVSYPELVKLAGGTPVFVETDRANDFKVTAADIEKYVTDRTRALIICNPSNPLGTVHTREELEAIAEFCYSRGIYIIADEVYEVIDFDGGFVSMASVSEEAKEITVLVNGLSKSVPMTGWRIGYTACAPEIAAAITAFQGHMTSHPSIISMWAGVEALKNSGEYTRMMVEEYRKRMHFATEFLRRELPEIGFIEPKGAFYLFLDIRGLESRLDCSESMSYDFVMRLLEEKHVAVVPGKAFGKEGYLRVAYATDLDTLMEGLRRMRDFVRAL
ncbi:MAG: pyridoxal phosphate-dependent aminotransferase [Clostridia bacterium]|nr:pyridoxal phosphate-dependent aminotransferase [Clostridia bacterium]